MTSSLTQPRPVDRPTAEMVRRETERRPEGKYPVQSIETLLHHDRAEWLPGGEIRVRRPRVDVSSPRGDDRPISARQLAALALVAEGYSSREIAAILRLRETTVKQYVARALRKLGASNRAQAIAICFRLGMLRWSDPDGRPLRLRDGSRRAPMRSALPPGG